MAETGGQKDVLADDVTMEELEARPKQPRPARKASSTAAYSATANKWWPMFLKRAGWDAEVKGVFIDDDGTPHDGTFRQLFIWLYEQDVTKGVFKPMLAWAQAQLNTQLRAKMSAFCFALTTCFFFSLVVPLVLILPVQLP